MHYKHTIPDHFTHKLDELKTLTAGLSESEKLGIMSS